MRGKLSEQPGNTEIGNLDNGRVVVSEQHILQLQVTVGDALRMHVLLTRELRRRSGAGIQRTAKASQIWYVMCFACDSAVQCRCGCCAVLCNPNTYSDVFPGDLSVRGA